MSYRSVFLVGQLSDPIGLLATLSGRLSRSLGSLVTFMQRNGDRERRAMTISKTYCTVCMNRFSTENGCESVQGRMCFPTSPEAQMCGLYSMQRSEKLSLKRNREPSGTKSG